MYSDSKTPFFLTKLLKSEQDDLASRVFRTLSADNVYSISLIEQCRWLLEELGLCWILQKCLSDPTSSDTVKDLQNIILKQDWSLTVNSARNHPSLKHIVCSNLVAARPAGAVIGIEHRTLEPRELDFFSAFSPLCVVRFSVIVFVHYVNVKYHHIKTTLIT